MKQPQGRPDWQRDGQGDSAQVCVLIDGDGIPSKYIDTILTEAMTLGPLLVPRVLGNWDQPTLQGWQRLLIPYRLERRHHDQVTPGKNATDIALVIDVLINMESGCFAWLLLIATIHPWFITCRA